MSLGALPVPSPGADGQDDIVSSALRRRASLSAALDSSQAAEILPQGGKRLSLTQDPSQGLPGAPGTPLARRNSRRTLNTAVSIMLPTLMDFEEDEDEEGSKKADSVTSSQARYDAMKLSGEPDDSSKQESKTENSERSESKT